MRDAFGAPSTCLEDAMKTLGTWVTLAMALVAGCSSAGETSKPSFDVARSSLARDLSPVVSAANQEKLSADNAAFAIDLYHAVRKGPEVQGRGIFLSPHSISTALAMTYAGARGTT